MNLTLIWYMLNQEQEVMLLRKNCLTVKAASKKVVHKTSQFLENKIAKAVTKSNDKEIARQEPVEGILILPQKRNYKKYYKYYKNGTL